MSLQSYAAQYRNTGLSSAVMEADPHRLVALLLSGACDYQMDRLEPGDGIQEQRVVFLMGQPPDGQHMPPFPRQLTEDGRAALRVFMRRHQSFGFMV